MSKIYIDNPNLIVAKSIIFGSIQNEKFANIFEIMTLTSGEYLPVSEMESGNIKVYGGGGLTSQTHSIPNVKVETLGIGRVGARCGCTFIVEPNSWITDNALYISKLKIEYDLRFLVHYLNFINLNKLANTAAQPVISLKRIANVKIPIVPVEIQIKISNVLDEIESGKSFFDDDEFGLNGYLLKINSIESLQTELKTQATLLTQLRQAYLQEAVMGQLTAPTTDDAHALLADIKAQKAQLIKEGKLRKEKPLPPIKPEEIPFEIPENWVWCRLGEVCEIGTGATPLTSNSDYYKNGNVPWVTSSLTGKLFVDEATNYITEKAVKETNCKIYTKGTLLIAMYGQGKTRGQVTELLIDAATNQACVALEFSDKYVDLKSFVKVYFQKIYFEIRELASGGAQPNLNMLKIKSTLIPLPPLSEQQAIVAKVAGLLEKVSALEAENKAQQAELERLMSAVLQESFSTTVFQTVQES